MQVYHNTLKQRGFSLARLMAFFCSQLSQIVTYSVFRASEQNNDKVECLLKLS